MRELSNLEKRIYSHLDTFFTDKFVKKNKVINHLKNTFEFDDELIYNLYSTWYFYRGSDYDTLKINDSNNGLVGFLEKIIDNHSPESVIDDLYENNKPLLERIYGDFFKFNGLPDLTWNSLYLEINLYLDHWEEYFSGFESNDDDIYIYNNYVLNNYGGYDSENYDSDEFNYLNYNETTIELLEKLALLNNLDEWPGKYNHKIEYGEIPLFLFNNISQKDLDSLINDYMYELNYLSYDYKKEKIREYYNENMVFPSYSDYDKKYIEIPYDELIKIIYENKLINLSELKDIKINGEIELWDFYNSLEPLDDWEELTNLFNKELEEIIENMYKVKGLDYDTLVIDKESFINKLNKLGFKYTSNGFYQNDLVKLNIGDLNTINKKIKILYNGKYHSIPVDDLSNWALGGVLNLDERFKLDINENINHTYLKPSGSIENEIFKFLEGVFIKKKFFDVNFKAYWAYGALHGRWCLDDRMEIGVIFYFDYEDEYDYQPSITAELDEGKLFLNQDFVKLILSYFNVRKNYMLYLLEEWFEANMLSEIKSFSGRNDLYFKNSDVIITEWSCDD